MKKLLLSLFALGTLLTVNAEGPANLVTSQNKPLLKSPKNITIKKAATRATLDDDNWFGYSGPIYDGLGPGMAGAVMEGVMEIPEELAQAWKGLNVDAVSIAFGQSSSKDVNIYVTKDLDGVPSLMQKATMTKEVGWNDVTLDQAYTIDGEGFYIGFQSEIKTATDYPICIDGIYTDLPYGDIIGLFAISNDGVQQGGYYNYGDQFGSVCLKLHLSAPSNVNYGAILNTVYQDKYIMAAEEKFDLSFSINNIGAKSITSADVKVTIDGKEQTPTVKVLGEGSTDSSNEETTNNLIPFGTLGFISLEGIVAAGEGTQKVTVTVTGLGGADGTSGASNLSFETEILVVESTFPKAFLVEEYTGTWCGFCPRGMVGMHYMEENYGDKGFIGIAVHYAPNGADKMQASTYAELGAYAYTAFGYPSAMLNRVEEFDPSQSTLQQYWAAYEGATSPAKIEVKATYDADSNVLTCKTTSTFGFSSDDAKYAIAFVMTQNNVGPYTQTNYFNGSSPQYSLEGWNDRGGTVATLYDHVARFITGTGGIAESVPTTIEANTPYEYSVELDLTQWMPDLLDMQNKPVATNLDNCTIIAMLLDSQSGEVVNAAKMSLNGMAGVESILAEPNDGTYKVFNLQGVKMLETKDASQVNNLPAGIYIINGKKILVK